ncbi:hypothetical protein TorRG33x02_099660, partial [Trema orientale]
PRASKPPLRSYGATSHCKTSFEPCGTALGCEASFGPCNAPLSLILGHIEITPNTSITHLN